jgi:RNA polymerase sigma-70 factor (ECF subfamily)
MKDESDEEIVSKIREGNKDLYGVLIERYENKLTRYGKRFVSSKDSITDVVQDVFIKAYVNLNSFDTSRSFSSWIYRIAHNEYVNLLKKKKSSNFSLFEFDTFFPQFVTGKNPYEEAVKKEEKEKIEKVIDILPPKYKEPLLLFLYEDKSYEEISEILEIPKATVGVRIMRAKQQLKEFLGDYE